VRDRIQRIRENFAAASPRPTAGVRDQQPIVDRRASSAARGSGDFEVSEARQTFVDFD
jgi:hypothetical protein